MGNDLQKTESGKSGGATSASDQYPFVPASNRVNSIWDHFKEGKSLGEGASCSVVVATHKQSGTKTAMKIMKKKDKWNPMLFAQEVAILSQLNDHKNILQYTEAYIDPLNFYFNTKMLGGGELFDRIKELKNFNEDQAKIAMRQIISAMAHCHQVTELNDEPCNGIVHRDLKPENIVYQEKGGDELCIIDFGDAKAVIDDDVYDDFVGTAFYLAPEVVRQRKGWELKASDMWTIGVICYVLCTGRPPFWGRDNREILTKILKGKLTFPKKTKLTKETKSFIKSLIVVKPEKRLRADQALAHPWLAESANDSQGETERGHAGDAKTHRAKKKKHRHGESKRDRGRRAKSEVENLD